MLESITVKNFKSIIETKIKLEKINFLIGSNNSGKTSLLQAIQFAVAVSQTTLLQECKWKDNNITRSILPSELVYSPLRDVSALARGGQLRQGDRYTISVEFNHKELSSTVVQIARGKNINILAKLFGEELGKELQSMDKPFSIFVPGLAGIPFSEEFKTQSIVRKAAARGDANNVFRNILWFLKDNDKDGWKEFINRFQEIFPEYNIEIEFDQNTDENIKAFLIKTTGTIEEKVPIDAAGTGILQAIQILSYINVYKPQLLILDEPDAHLHPNNQRKLLKIITNLANEKDIQIIISTHSRHMIDEAEKLAEDCKIHWFSEGEIVDEKEVDIVKVFMDIGALDKGDLLRNGYIKSVVLTEDTTDLDMLENLLESSKFDMKKIDIWSYGGCTKVESAIILAEFIRKHAPGVNILLHRDKDYLTDEEIEEFKSKVTSDLIDIFITEGTDIESYYLNSKHLAQLNNLNEDDLEIIIEKATNERSEESKTKFTNSRYYLNKKNGNKEIKPGDLWKECEKKYNSDNIRYRYGKGVLKSLKNLFQNTYKFQLIFKEKSNFLEDEYLSMIAIKHGHVK